MALVWPRYVDSRASQEVVGASASAPDASYRSLS